MLIQSEKIADAAREMLKSCGYFVENLWHIEDIHTICREHEYHPLNDDEAMAVFNIAHEQFDGEYGFSWPQLEKATAIYFQRKMILITLCNQDA